MPVEDDACVGTAIVGLEEVDDRVTADLLLAVARNSDVHRQLACLMQQLRGFHEAVELAFVVRDPAAVVPTVALGELKRRRFPELEWRRRLNVEVPVDEHRRSADAVGVGGNLAEHELALAERRHLRLAAGPFDELGEPVSSPKDVLAVRGIRAHRRDRDELAKLFDPSLLHGRPLYGTTPPGRGAWQRLRAHAASSSSGSRSGGSVHA